MASSICTRCALRLKNLTTNPQSLTQSRTLTHHPENFTRGLPTFQPTSLPQLDALLSDFRNKHFFAAALQKPQWDLIFRQQNKTLLAENPQSVKIGAEVFELKFLGGKGGMPNRKDQLKQVLGLLRREAESGDWDNVPNLLRGLHAMGKTPPSRVRARILRLALVRERYDIVLQCLMGAQHTGFSLTDAETLHATIWGLRWIAERGEWSEEAVARALKAANEVAACLEMPVHGGGRGHVGLRDARRSPFVLGVFLELNAVFALRFRGGEDADGRVKAFAERLLYNIPDDQKSLPPLELPKAGPVMPMREYAPLLHGLKLANRMLGDTMPEKAKAEEIIRNYGNALRELNEKLVAQGFDTPPPKENVGERTYGREALGVWRSISGDD